MPIAEGRFLHCPPLNFPESPPLKSAKVKRRSVSKRLFEPVIALGAKFRRHSLVSHVLALGGERQVISMEEYTTAFTGTLQCKEHRRLMEDFAAAVKELLALHQQQFEAAVHGDADCTRFDLLIHTATEREQEAKYAYLRHVEEHGCNRFDAVIIRRA